MIRITIHSLILKTFKLIQLKLNKEVGNHGAKDF